MGIAPRTVHMISAPEQPGRNQMYVGRVCTSKLEKLRAYRP